MNDQSILPRPRPLHIVAGDLEAHRKHREVLMRLAGDFAALDVRPLVWIEGESITPTRAFAVPDELRTMLRDEHATIRGLELEYADAIARERRY